uniref:A-type ATP synthase subunit I n=2 Tax=Ignisphaera aggregans TaxID=334771 RepID=A0A7C5UT63_9CREN
MTNLRYLLLSDPDIAYKVYVITSTDYVGRVTEELFRLGVFEPTAQEVKEKELEEIKEYIKLIEQAKKIYDDITSYIKQSITIEVSEIPVDIRGSIENIYKKLLDVLSTIKLIESEISKKSKRLEINILLKQLIEKILEKYPDADTSILQYKGSLYTIGTFIASKQSLNLLKDRASSIIIEIENEKYCIMSAIFLTRDYEAIVKTLPSDIEMVNIIERYGLKKLIEVLNDIAVEIEDLKKYILVSINKIDEILKKNINDIALLKVLLDVEYKKIEIWKTTLSSRYLSTIVGWIPKSKIDLINRSLKHLPIYIIYKEDPNPPVDFNNLKPFKPFELITEMYGVPSPNEWDPTPFLTYSFILFFSLMFADIGYGIGIALAAKYILPKFVDNPRSLGFRRLQQVLYVSSAACIFLGILSRSFLGSLLGRYLPISRLLDYSDLMSMMGLSIVIGYIFITIAHILTTIKYFRLRDRGGILSEIGIVILLISGAQYLRPYLYSYFKAYIPIIPIVYEYSLWLCLIAIAIIIAGKFISLSSLGALLWIFDVAGIIGDIFSFIRIAGIGMGSAMLAEIFNGFIAGAFAMGSTMNIVIGIAAGVLMAFILHTFNLAVSAVSPFVHSLRLCLFEISSKFLEGAGKRIQPIKIAIGPTILGQIKP